MPKEKLDRKKIQEELRIRQLNNFRNVLQKYNKMWGNVKSNTNTTLKDLFKDKLELENIKIERTHKWLQLGSNL